MLTEQQLRSFSGRDNLDKNFLKTFVELLGIFKDDFHLNTPERLAFFLGQVKAEIYIRRDGSVRTRESMNYSVAGLMKTFSHFRKNPHLATKLGRKANQSANQTAIANLVYADENRNPRYRLGNIKDGDGWLFRGCGILQSTGRENIMLDLNLVELKTGICVIFDTELETDKTASEELMSTYTVAILMGMAHWERKKLYLKSSSMSVTNTVNMGLSSRDKLARERYAKFAYDVLLKRV